MRIQLRQLVRTELLLQRRHGVVATSAVLGLLLVVALLAVPPDWRAGLLPWVLLLEVASIGFFVLPALAVIERGTGVTAALALTRLHPATALAVRLGVLLPSAMLTALPAILISGVDHVTTVLAGVVVAVVLFALIAVLMVGRETTLGPFVARSPLVAAPLLVPAVLHGSGAIRAPALFASPATGAFELLSGSTSWLQASWLLAWIAALALLAIRLGAHARPVTGSVTARTPRRTTLGGSATDRPRPFTSFARVDGRALLADRVLILLLLGIPLIALALRAVAGPGVAWAQTQYAVDLGPHLPAITAFVLAIHIPTILGLLVGLLFLEDRDAGLLPTLAVTPAGVGTLIAYRLTALAAAVVVVVPIATLIAGIRHPAGVPGVAALALAGGFVASVPAMLLAAYGRDRAHGMVLTKVITLPLYLPVAWWYVDSPLGWLFGVVPTAFAVRAAWATTPTLALLAAGVTGLLSALAVRLLAPRLLTATVTS